MLSTTVFQGNSNIYLVKTKSGKERDVKRESNSTPGGSDYSMYTKPIPSTLGTPFSLRCNSTNKFRGCKVFSPSGEEFNIGISGNYSNSRVDSLSVVDDNYDPTKVCGIHIKEVKTEDAGPWRCEMEYKRNNTKDTIQYLRVAGGSVNVSKAGCECNGKADRVGRGGVCTEGKKGRWCYVYKGRCSKQRKYYRRYYSYTPCKTSACVCNGKTDVHGHGGSCGEYCYVDDDATCPDNIELGGGRVSKALCKRPGIVIIGGYDGKLLVSTELFNPLSGKSCYLKNHVATQFHSLDQLEDGSIITCGGYPDKNTCEKFEATPPLGAWKYYSTLLHHRYSHSSLVSQGKILLMGGEPNTYSKTTEVVTGENQWTLQQETSNACTIKDGSTIILTGGYRPVSNYPYLNTVTRYNIQGFMEHMPSLRTARAHHGCGSFINQHNTKVYVVAGGRKKHGGTDLRSTELLYASTSKWRPGPNLPRTLFSPASVSLDHSVLLIGGYCSSCPSSQMNQAQIMSLNSSGTWLNIGNLKEGRYGAAASLYEIPEDLRTEECD